MQQEAIITAMQQGFDAFRADVGFRFEQNDQRFEQVDKRFEQVDQRFEQVDKRFDEMQNEMRVRFEQVDGQIRQLYVFIEKEVLGQLRIVAEAVQGVQETLAAHTARYFPALEERVTVLEVRVDRLEKRRRKVKGA